MGRQLTIRAVPDEVASQLDKMSIASGRSVNALVNEILANAVGESGRRRRLQRYATWTARDEEEFDKALREQRQIDEAVWR